MIAVAAGVKVLVATKPVDFRKGGDGLMALVRETLGQDPFSGTIFVFRAKRADRVKMGLQEIEWVLSATSERWEHACEHLEPQIFLVA